MSKNKQVMSIAIRPDLKEELGKFSKRKGLSNSAYIGNLVEQAVKLNIDDDPVVIGRPIEVESESPLVIWKQPDEDVSPVVLKIPSALRTDKAQLERWMTVQMAGIVKAMSK